MDKKTAKSRASSKSKVQALSKASQTALNSRKSGKSKLTSSKKEIAKSKMKSLQEDGSDEEVSQELRYKSVPCKDTEILFDSTTNWSTQDRTVYELVTSMFSAVVDRMDLKPAMRQCVVEDDMVEEEEEGSAMSLGQFHDSSSEEDLNLDRSKDANNSETAIEGTNLEDKRYRDRLEMVRTALEDNTDVSKLALAKLLTDAQIRPPSETVLTRKKPHLDSDGDLLFNGHHYNGRVSRLTLEGKGKLKLSDGTLYEGDFTNGMIDGEGRLEWPDGSWYEGHFKDNRRHGYGLYRSRDNPQEVYIGSWFQGKRHGFGCQYYNLGEDDFYEGDFLCNRREGQGLRRWADGQTYAGSWEQDTIHGFGVMRFLNGTYSGQWSHGQMHGTGTYTWTDGQLDYTMGGTQSPTHREMDEKGARHTVRGTEMSHGCKNDSTAGTLSLARGYNVYEGHWRRNQRHGKGMLTSASGIQFRGTWIKNKKQGRGVLIRPNGTDIFQVTCVDDVLYLKDTSGDNGGEKSRCFCESERNNGVMSGGE